MEIDTEVTVMQLGEMLLCTPSMDEVTLYDWVDVLFDAVDG